MKEWATTTEIAQLTGETVRRIQQLTQAGVLETKASPGGGARRYNTRETMQRYKDTAGKEDAQRHNDAKKLLDVLNTLPPEKRWIALLMMDAFINGMTAQESIDTTGREKNNA